MFDPTSRYYSIEDTKTIQDDHEVIYKKRRFVPQKTSKNHITRVILGGDRLDLIANEVLGDSRQFWKICDVNDNFHPLETTKTTGKKIKIPSDDEVEI